MPKTTTQPETPTPPPRGGSVRGNEAPEPIRKAQTKPKTRELAAAQAQFAGLSAEERVIVTRLVRVLREQRIYWLGPYIE